jgi:ATP-dependent Clp protease protease subunit
MRIIQAKGKGLSIKAATDAKEAEVIIYGGIGDDFWGDGSMISLKNFSDEMKTVPNDITVLNVRISSPGGDVFQGIGIYNRLLDWKRKASGRSIKVYIDGWAASIASIIALAGDEIIIGEGALYMIHLPWTFAYGNRMELDNTINRLMDIEEQMLGIYSKKSGLSRTEVRSLLEAETWMSAEEAIEKGFVDKMAEDTVAISASAFKSPWMKTRPEKFVSEKDAAQAAINEKIKKMEARLNRK